MRSARARPARALRRRNISPPLRRLELQFSGEGERLIETIAGLVAGGARTIRVEPGSAAVKLMSGLGEKLLSNLRLVALGPRDDSWPPAVEAVGSTDAVDVVAILDTEAEAVAGSLMNCLDLPAGVVVAPVTERHSSRRCLFLISIPKAGTHLLYRLAEMLGYRAGVVCPPDPKPQFWYCVEYSNSHTTARDFFIDTVRRSPFGNKDHPFTRSPAIFIYRDPRDILVSEANWYHRTDASPFHGYLERLSFDERIKLLLDDPVLLGSIRDRTLAFAPWLDLPNVIPVSFEELIGEIGGGGDDERRRLIWSLQLKLQVDGVPDEIASQLFDRSSPTFVDGKVGAWGEYFDTELRQRFAQLPQDFMQQFGYELEAVPGTLPNRGDSFRRRPLRTDDDWAAQTPYLVEAQVSGFNIVRFRHEFFALPLSRGALDLAALSEAELRAFAHDAELAALHEKIAASHLAMSNTPAPAHPAPSEISPLEIPMPEDAVLSRLRALEETLEERDSRLHGAEMSLQELRQRFRSLERTVEERHHRIQSLEEALEEREGRIGSLTRLLAARDARIRTLEDGAQAAEAAAEEFKLTLDRVAARLANLERQGNARENAVQTGLVERDERTAAVEQRASAALAMLADRVKGLENRSVTHAERLTSLEQTMDERSHRLMAVESGTAGHTERLTSLEYTMDERSRRLTTVETGTAVHGERLNGLESGMGAHEDRLSGLESEKATHADRLSSLEQTMDERSQRLTAIEGALGERDGRLLGLEAKTVQLEHWSATIEEALGALRDPTTAAGLRLATLEHEKNGLGQRLGVVEAMIEDRDRQRAADRDAIAEAEKRIGHLAGELRDQAERIGALVRELADRPAETAVRTQRLDSLEEALADRARRLSILEDDAVSRRDVETASAATDLRLETIAVTIAERDRRITDLEIALAAANANLQAVNADRERWAKIDDQVADLRSGVQKGLFAVAVLEKSLQGVEESLVELRLDRLETELHAEPAIS
jgi:predicted  nucleic acid-binding Zn-ribbon protein